MCKEGEVNNELILNLEVNNGEIKYSIEWVVLVDRIELHREFSMEMKMKKTS
jgi:hypothetical protein